MNNTAKKPYEAATITLVCYSCEDIMIASTEKDGFFFGDLDSFLSLSETFSL